MKLSSKTFSSGIFFLLLLIYLPMQVQAQDTLVQKKSVVTSVGDQKLLWGPCPDFMPEGCEIAILHGDPSKRNVDVFLRIPAGSVIPNHMHTSAERMILVGGEMEVTYEGEEPARLKIGTYAFGPAKKPHSAKCGDSSPCTLFIAFEEPLDAVLVKD